MVVKVEVSTKEYSKEFSNTLLGYTIKWKRNVILRGMWPVKDARNTRISVSGLSQNAKARQIAEAPLGHCGVVKSPKPICRIFSTLQRFQVTTLGVMRHCGTCRAVPPHNATHPM